MIEQQAVIIAIECSSNVDDELANSIDHMGDSEIATLEIMRKTACGLCGQTRGCGNSLWGKIFAHQSKPFKAANNIHAKVGDGVIVGVNEQVVLRSALLLYALPLTTMMIGALLSGIFVAKTANEADLYAVIGSVIGLVLGFAWVKSYVASAKYSTQNQPIILRLDNENISQCVSIK